MLTLGLEHWMVGILVVFFVMVSGLVILTILIQKPQGGGLSGAFGSGAGSGQTAFGAKTGDALTIATIGMFIVWVLFAIGLNFAARPPDATAAGTAAIGAAEGGAAQETTSSTTEGSTSGSTTTGGGVQPGVAPTPAPTPGGPVAQPQTPPPAGDRPAEPAPQPAGDPGPTGGG